jgi:hypothetical protein
MTTITVAATQTTITAAVTSPAVTVTPGSTSVAVTIGSASATLSTTSAPVSVTFEYNVPAPVNVWTPQGIVLDAALAAEEGVLQEPSVIYEGNAQILSGNVFKMWYSYGSTARLMGYAESLDGIAWTKYSSNPIVTNGTRAHVFKDGATYYMYVILNPGGLSKLSSSDGVTWATDATGVMGGDGGQWDADGIANIHVWIEGAVWYMLYESNASGGVYSIGLATSPNGETWTKSLSNPVLTNGVGSVSHPWFYKSNSIYYTWTHVATSGALPTDIAKYYSADLISWTRSPAGLVYSRLDRNEGVGTSAGQVADVSLVEVGGTTYMYHTAYTDGSTASGKIKLATAPYTVAQLALSDQGAISTYKPLLIFNEGFERLGTGGADIFESWIEDTGTGGAIARTTTATEFRSGTSGIAAVKITAGSGINTNVRQSVPAANFVSGEQYIYSGWARGDGTNAPRIRVFDGVDLIAGSFQALPVSTTWQQFTCTITYPGSGNVSFYCYCPATNGGVAYFDDVSVRHA